MTQPRDIDRILNIWFNDGASVASDRVIDVVADRIEHQSQRPAWRLRLGGRRVDFNLRFAAVVAVVLAVGIVGFSLGGAFAPPPRPPSPAPTAGPTTAPTPTHRATPSPRPQVPLTQRFTSAINRYSISYPDGWTVKPATATYRWGSPLTLYDPTVDVLTAPGGKTALYITSLAIPAGVTETSWHLTQYQLRPDVRIVCPPNEPARNGLSVTVGGVAGSAGAGCRGVGYLTPITNHRGYEFLLYPSPTGSGSDQEWADEDLFVAMLGSVVLNP